MDNKALKQWEKENFTKEKDVIFDEGSMLGRMANSTSNGREFFVLIKNLGWIASSGIEETNGSRLVFVGVEILDSNCFGSITQEDKDLIRSSAMARSLEVALADVIAVTQSGE